MKYIHYTIEDFVKDEYFQKWVLDTDSMTSNFWNTWVERHPEKKEIIKEAKKIILLLNYNENRLESPVFDEMWQHIIEKRENKKEYFLPRIKNLSRPIFLKYAVVACVLVVGFISFLMVNYDNEVLVVEPVIVKNKIEKGSDKAILTLADGTNVSLEKGKKYKSNNVTSNGDEIVYNEDISNEKAYNYLTIPRGGHFFIQLSDGTKVWLNSESQLKYPVAFTKKETREVELVYGEAYFDVSPSSENNGYNFKVFNNNQEIHVLGTEFNVKAYKDELNVFTTLIEGKVALTYNNKKLDLKPNQQSTLNIKNNSLLVKTVDVYNEISWKEGVFSFEDKTLKEIMKVLSRWYDMDVIIKNKKIEEEKFIGILDKNQEIEEILNSIKNIGIINNYEIKNKKIVLE